MINYILKTLQKEDYVFIERVGAFRLQLKHASIDKDTIHPPHYEVVFSHADSEENNFALANQISRDKQCLFTEANEQITAWVGELLTALQHNKSVTYEEFGTFMLDKKGNITFESALIPQLNSQFEGLEPIDLKHFEVAAVPMVEPEPEPVMAPESEPVVKPEPVETFPETSPQPEPEPVVEPEPEPVVAPESEPVVDPEPVETFPETSPQPEPEPVVEPEPEPVVAPESEPVVDPEPVETFPETSPQPEPEPVVEPEPEPVVVPESEPVVDPEPVETFPETSPQPEPEPVVEPEPEPVVVSESEPVVDPEPVETFPETSPQPEPEPIVEPEPVVNDEEDEEDDDDEYDEDEEEPKKRHGLAWLWIILLLLVVLGVLGYIFKDKLLDYYHQWQEKRYPVEQVVEPQETPEATATIDEVVEPTEPVEEPQEEVVESKPEVFTPAVIKQSSDGKYDYIRFEKGHYYAIAGSFPTEADVIRHIRQKKLDQYSPKILKQDGVSNLRVCIGVFNTEEEAESFAKGVSASYWVLK
jgi:hypothetical protein